MTCLNCIHKDVCANKAEQDKRDDVEVSCKHFSDQDLHLICPAFIGETLYINDGGEPIEVVVYRIRVLHDHTGECVKKGSHESRFQVFASADSGKSYEVLLKHFGKTVFRSRQEVYDRIANNVPDQRIRVGGSLFCASGAEVICLQIAKVYDPTDPCSEKGMIRAYSRSGGAYDIDLDHIGKTYFLTHEEAVGKTDLSCLQIFNSRSSCYLKK